jgi:hypothetical protein
MLVGFRVTDEIAGGLTVKVVFADPPKELPVPVAVIVSVVTAFTLIVVTVNVPEVAPATIVIVAGTVTEDEVSDKFTVRCAVVAAAATGPFSVTVPVEEGFAKPP